MADVNGLSDKDVKALRKLVNGIVGERSNIVGIQAVISWAMGFRIKATLLEQYAEFHALLVDCIKEEGFGKEFPYPTTLDSDSFDWLADWVMQEHGHSVADGLLLCSLLSASVERHAFGERIERAYNKGTLFDGRIAPYITADMLGDDCTPELLDECQAYAVATAVMLVTYEEFGKGQHPLSLMSHVVAKLMEDKEGDFVPEISGVAIAKTVLEISREANSYGPELLRKHDSSVRAEVVQETLRVYRDKQQR